MKVIQITGNTGTGKSFLANLIPSATTSYYGVSTPPSINALKGTVILEEYREGAEDRLQLYLLNDQIERLYIVSETFIPNL